MRKLPNGVSDYETLIKENRIYIDKTKYIEKMEELSDKTLMFLRPRKFGKTLYTNSSIDAITFFLNPFIVDSTSVVSIPEKLNLNIWYLFLFGVGFFPIYVFPNNVSNSFSFNLS